MDNDFASVADSQPAIDPHSVSRGSKIHLSALGIDSLYLVVEYPHSDVFDWWSSSIKDFQDPKLHEGIPFDDMVIRVGGNGYKLSVWDGNTRLYITNRVNDNLKDTQRANQGMGVMLQLSPQWLWHYGDILDPQGLREAIYAQLRLFGVGQPEAYPIRLNRLDVAVDVLGLHLSDFSLDEWIHGWTGYAKIKSNHFSSITGQLEGLTIGSSEGAVRFKVYNKAAESNEKGTSRFWRSVWGVGEEDEISVARFEWSIRCYAARFVKMRYLSDFTFEGFLKLLVYVSRDWGQLRVPQPDDTNPSRWPIAPLWVDLLAMIDDWALHYDEHAKREYVYSVDLKDAYLRSLAGWIAGLQVRVGLELNKDEPATLTDGLLMMDNLGYTLADIERKARDKWEVASRLAGKRSLNDTE